VEFPDFGMGPATTFLSLVGPVIDAYSWHVVSSGTAARFALSQLPGAVIHELDTFSRHRRLDFLGIAPPGSVVVSVTNPHFAAWAAGLGYRVGVVDALDWLWDSSPAGAERFGFHLVQDYFGPSAGPGVVSGRRLTIRPVVDSLHWKPAQTRPGTAVVGFGGMSVPGGMRRNGEYAQWLLAAALPVLLDVAGCRRVSVIGGRTDLSSFVPPPLAGHPALRIHPGLGRAEYAALVRESEHIIVTPGLGTIHECAHAGLTPLFQPGFCVSMVRQLKDLSDAGYPYVAAWPWLDRAAAAVTGLPEVEGLELLAGLIDDTLRHATPEECGVTQALTRYIGRDSPARLPLADRGFPDGRDLFAHHLRKLLL
jgi:hypothetical protein